MSIVLRFRTLRLVVRLISNACGTVATETKISTLLAFIYNINFILLFIDFSDDSV